MPDEPKSGAAPQTLSPSEVETLLATMAEAPAADGAQAKSAEPAGPRRHDFRSPSFLTANELRKTRLRYDELARLLATRFSIYLRLECSLRLAELETMTYRRFIERRAVPSHLAIFKVEPLSGVGLIEVPPALALALVDRQLGGAGKPLATLRDLTEIETEVLDLALMLVLREWCQEIAQLPDAKPVLIGHETNARFLQFSATEANLLSASFELRLNEVAAPLTLGMPSTMLESLVNQFSPPPELRRTVPDTVPPAPRWSSQLDDVTVPVSAFWTGLEITARELSQLKVGDILQVDPRHFNNVSVCLARIPKFSGRLGTQNQAWAIELTGKLSI
jgi:flagellar motor switch protein FliM